MAKTRATRFPDGGRYRAVMAKKYSGMREQLRREMRKADSRISDPSLSTKAVKQRQFSRATYMGLTNG